MAPVSKVARTVDSITGARAERNAMQEMADSIAGRIDQQRNQNAEPAPSQVPSEVRITEIYDEFKTLEERARSLEPGGRAGFDDLVFESLEERTNKLFEELERLKTASQRQPTPSQQQQANAGGGDILSSIQDSFPPMSELTIKEDIIQMFGSLKNKEGDVLNDRLRFLQELRSDLESVVGKREAGEFFEKAETFADRIPDDAEVVVNRVPSFNNVDNWEITADGVRIGRINSIVTDSAPDTLNITNINAAGGPGVLGIKHMRSVRNQLLDEYPEAQNISGFRISGVRARAGLTDDDATTTISTGRQPTPVQQQQARPRNPRNWPHTLPDGIHFDNKNVPFKVEDKRIVRMAPDEYEKALELGRARQESTRLATERQRGQQLQQRLDQSERVQRLKQQNLERLRETRANRDAPQEEPKPEKLEDGVYQDEEGNTFQVKDAEIQPVSKPAAQQRGRTRSQQQSQDDQMLNAMTKSIPTREDIAALPISDLGTQVGTILEDVNRMVEAGNITGGRGQQVLNELMERIEASGRSDELQEFLDGSG